MLAVTLYNAATTVTPVDSGLSNEAACWAINAAATYGSALGLRFVCSSFSTSISQTNLADTSMVLFKASEIFSERSKLLFNEILYQKKESEA